MSDPHPTPNSARMEPGLGVVGAAGPQACRELREMEVEVELVLREGEKAGGVYNRVSGIWRKRRPVVFEGDGKD